MIELDLAFFEMIFGIVSSLTAIITFAYQIVKLIQKRRIQKNQHEVNVENSAIINSFNPISIDKSVKLEQHFDIVQTQPSKANNSDDGLVYLVIILLFTPLLFKLMKDYQPIAVTVLTLSALAVWLYNRFKIKDNIAIGRTKEFTVHYLICCSTAVIPIFSYFTFWAPMSFAECYRLVFSSNAGWIARMFKYSQPVLYYLSLIFGLILTTLMIINNIKASSRLFKTQDISVLSKDNKNRIISLCICLITVSGGLYWIGYGMVRLTQLIQPTMNQLLNG